MPNLNSKQIRNMVICIVIIIIVAIVFLIVLLANVNIETTELTNEVTVEENEDYVYSGFTESEFVPSEQRELADYSLVQYGENATYRIVLDDNTVYFEITDEDIFLEKYAGSEIDTKKEIVTYDYSIENIFIGSIGDEEYLLLITDDGNLGIMNIGDAISNNVFRINQDLVSLDSGVVELENAICTVNNEEVSTILAVTYSGKSYDLIDFVE